MFKRLHTVRKLLILFLFLIPSPDSGAQDQDIISILRNEVSRYGQARVLIGYPGSLSMNDLSTNVSVSAVRGKSIEIVLSPLTVDWFIEQNIGYEIIERPDVKSIVTAGNTRQAMEWESYPSYTQYDSIMRSFASVYPLLCLLDTIGTSINGKLVLVLKISDNVSEDEPEPETFYSSTMHGDETGGFILMLRLADYLLKNYGTVSTVTTLIDNLEIWINPLANPDGTYRTGNTIVSPTRTNANGYDLNRNFPDPMYTTPPVKQKETLDMMQFMKEHHFVISANFHSGVEVVNYPWDRWSRLHADNTWFYNISRRYADTVHLYAPAGYMDFKNSGITNGFDWYYVYGGRQDYITWEKQGREVTIEIHDTYVTPASQLNSLWQYNWRSLLGYLENALYGIHGIVKNKVTGEPLEARVFIAGHDKDSSHVYSGKSDGTFVRLLAPGIWDLTFTAWGCLPAVVEDVVVTEGVKTEISVELQPILNPVDTSATPTPLLYPNPSSQSLRVVLPGRQTGDISVQIYNSLGYKLADYERKTSEGYPLIIDVSRFPEGIYTLVLTNIATHFTDKSRFVVVRN
ncbi:MAG: M14 family zinc carboxypeptidase [Bacteroidota bacterium]